MTDLPDVMPLLRKNVDANQAVWSACGGKVYTQALQWGSDIQNWKTPDVLLLADCVYYMEVYTGTLKSFCAVCRLSATAEGSAADLSWLLTEMCNYSVSDYFIFHVQHRNLDYVFNFQAVEPLVNTLCCLADENTEVIISQEERDTEKQRTVWKFFQEMLQSHFEVMKIPEKELHPDFCSVDIVVLRAMKRPHLNKGHLM
jgi:hypothetical protein